MTFAFSDINKNYSHYRKWLYLSEKFSRKPSDLRIMSFNILADSYAYDYLFPACSNEDKAFDFRSKLLKKLFSLFFLFIFFYKWDWESAARHSLSPRSWRSKEKLITEIYVKMFRNSKRTFWIHLKTRMISNTAKGLGIE